MGMWRLGTRNSAAWLWLNVLDGLAKLPGNLDLCLDADAFFPAWELQDHKTIAPLDVCPVEIVPEVPIKWKIALHGDGMAVCDGRENDISSVHQFASRAANGVPSVDADAWRGVRIRGGKIDFSHG